MNAQDIMKALAAEFPPSAVSWRAGVIKRDGGIARGMALAYIDARDVMARLDAVMGANWQVEYVPMPDGTKCCKIGLKIDGEWVWRSNGAGDTQVEADKGSYSDAFKRAAVLWGIGRYLYDLPSPWMDVMIGKNGKGGTLTHKSNEMLRKALERRQRSSVAA